MNRFAIGDLVVLIDGDGYMPPLHSIGEVLSEKDEDGDYDVYFPTYPCPVSPGTYWCTQESWLKPFKAVPIDSMEIETA